MENVKDSDIDKIEQKIINEDPPLYFIIDKGHNKIALDIVSKLLVKNPEQRLQMKEANRSQWYKINLSHANKSN